MNTSDLVVFIARLFSHVREATANAGNRVEAIQKWGGGSKGDSWCCWFVTMVLDLAFMGKSPIPRLGSCQEVLELARKNGWTHTQGMRGDLALFLNSEGHAHHIGICISDSYKGFCNVIAGNTSPDGASPNGTGVFEHNTFPSVYVAYPRSGQ